MALLRCRDETHLLRHVWQHWSGTFLNARHAAHNASVASRLEKELEAAHGLLASRDVSLRLREDENAAFQDEAAAHVADILYKLRRATLRKVLMLTGAGKAVDVATKIMEQHGKKMVDFRKGFEGNADIAALRAEVEEFAGKFDMPGFDAAGLI